MACLNKTAATKKMPLVITALVMILTASLQAQEQEVIRWGEDKKLQWEYFRKEPRKNHQAAAQSWTGVEFSGDCINGKFSIEVSAFFHPDSSWADKTLISNRLLKHEQAHFDIAEIYARKLIIALNRIQNPCDQAAKTRLRIQTILAANQQALTQEQQKYDRETYHGARVAEQQRWYEQIAAQLQEHERIIADITRQNMDNGKK
jgi:hypothetical protein